MQKLWTHKWLALSILVAILAGRMLLTAHHFYIHDDIQVFRLNEFVECIKSGQIPCRWSSGLGKGYGYPWFNFYPPMIYLVSGGFHLLGFSLITSLNLMAFITFILAAWGMFLLVKELTDREDLAFFGSMLLTLYPFHATNVFLRGVYAENFAWSLTPLLLFYLYRQIRLKKTQPILPALFAILFLTHIISSFVVTGLALLWSTYLSFSKNKKVLHNLLTVCRQIMMGIAMSGFFIIPAMAEKNLVQSDSLTVGYYSYLNHFVSLKQLFLDYTWNYGASYWAQPVEEMGYMVGHVHTALLIIATTIAILLARKNPRLKLALALSLTFISFLLLTHPKGAIIYGWIPQLSFVQFPWRFVGWAGIPLSLSIVVALSLLSHKITRWVLLLGTLALLIYSYPFFFPRAYDTYTDADFVSGQFKQEQQSKALFDYLPISVKQVKDEYASTPKNASNTFYYPGWYGNISGQPVELTSSDLYGMITPLDPKLDASKVELIWRETPFRLAMDILSLISICAYSLYLYKSHVQ